AVRQAREAMSDHLGHRREVVRVGAGLPDPELPVVGALRHPILEDDHRADRVLPHRVRDVVALDADRERLEVQRLAQLLERLHATRPLLLARRLLGHERVPRVLVRELLQATLLAALRDAHLDTAAALLGEELRERGQVAGVARDDDLRRHARRRAVVLEAEGLEDRVHVLALGVLEVERVPVDHLAAAQREDLHDRALALRREADDVDGADRLPLDRLALDEMLHGEEPVAVARRILEPLVARRLVHLLLELALDRPHVAREELDHAVDDRPVVLPGDVADARREAAVDVVVEARDPGVAARLGALARPVGKDAVEDVEGLADLLRVRVRAEVPDAAPVALAREHDARILVLDRDRDVREGLVVAQPHVERRPVPLHEVLLEVERLDLGARDDHLERGDAPRQLLDLGAGIRRGLEVRADARPERLRLADVEHLAALVAEEVDAGLRRQRLQLLFHTVLHGHGYRSRSMLAATLRILSVLAAALAVAPAAFAGGPQLVLGATEDAVRAPTLVQAKAQMDLLVLAGFRAVRITQVWTPGEQELSDKDTTILQNVAAAAKLDHVTVLTSVMNQGSRTTPLTDEDQADFAAYAASVVQTVPALQTIIVGNEPNLNRYWLPQFNEDGSDAAAPAYESLLAQTYDAVKAVAPTVTVLGGAVSPRGGDVPNSIRPTHSPTVFIHDLGQAWRGSGRTTPIMDGFAFHPYEDNSSVAPVDGRHPNSTTIALADYDKLFASLGEAFGDYELPIWYDE